MIVDDKNFDYGGVVCVDDFWRVSVDIGKMKDCFNCRHFLQTTIHEGICTCPIPEWVIVENGPGGSVISLEYNQNIFIAKECGCYCEKSN